MVFSFTRRSGLFQVILLHHEQARGGFLLREIHGLPSPGQSGRLQRHFQTRIVICLALTVTSLQRMSAHIGLSSSSSRWPRDLKTASLCSSCHSRRLRSMLVDSRDCLLPSISSRSHAPQLHSARVRCLGSGRLRVWPLTRIPITFPSLPSSQSTKAHKRTRLLHSHPCDDFHAARRPPKQLLTPTTTKMQRQPGPMLSTDLTSTTAIYYARPRVLMFTGRILRAHRWRFLFVLRGGHPWPPPTTCGRSSMRCWLCRTLRRP